MNKNREAPIIIVKKKGGHSGHHGGAWKVAFADFMTAMFALFLVLWIINQSTDIRSAIAGYFADPLGRANEYGSSIIPGDGAQTSSPRLRRQSEIVDMRKVVLDRVAGDLEKKIEESPAFSSVRGLIEITMTEDGLRVELMEDSTGVFFETGNAHPTSRGETLLSLIGSELGRISYPVKIEGHTDAHPFRQGQAYTNWELSADRANAARRILTAAGLGGEQIREVNGLADRKPKDPGNPFAARNRRVTIMMLLEDVEHEVKREARAS